VDGFTVDEDVGVVVVGRGDDAAVFDEGGHGNRRRELATDEHRFTRKKEKKLIKPLSDGPTTSFANSRVLSVLICGQFLFSYISRSQLDRRRSCRGGLCVLS
jgi:hypothetical protein